MKNTLYRDLRFTPIPLILLAFLIAAAGCKETTDATVNAQTNISDAQQTVFSSFTGFKEVILNANKVSYGAIHIDNELLNAWGMSASDEGEIWVSAADGGVSFVYNAVGDNLKNPINIPSHQ